MNKFVKDFHHTHNGGLNSTYQEDNFNNGEVLRNHQQERSESDEETESELAASDEDEEDEENGSLDLSMQEKRENNEMFDVHNSMR